MPVTQSLLHHTDIERIIADLDARYDMLDVRLGQYCLWPTIKVVLWRYLMTTYVADKGDSGVGLVKTRRSQRLMRYLSVMPSAAKFLIRGVWYQILHGRKLPQDGVVLVCSGRYSRDPQGRTLPTYFGNIMADTGFGPTITINDNRDFKIGPVPVLASQYFQAVSFMRMSIKLGLHLYPASFYTAVREIIARLKDFGQGCENCPHSAIWFAAAHFLETQAVYEGFFKRVKPRLVMLTDFDAHFGVTAAARNCDIPVYDMQHGTFWSNDLDHSWAASAGAKKEHLPFPDRLLVFGTFWQRIAAEQGYWNDSNVTVVGAPIMEQYLPLRKSPADFLMPERPTILYLSGDIKPASVSAWLDHFLKIAPQARLRIRLHPREIGHKSPYQFLADRYPGNVTFSHMGDATLNDILNSDIVVGTSTTAMIEAFVLGIPVISMGAGATPEGIAKNHNNALLSKYIDHVATPDDLVALINNMQKNQEKWQKRLEDIAAMVPDFYAPGYDANMKALIAEKVQP